MNRKTFAVLACALALVACKRSENENEPTTTTGANEPAEKGSTMQQANADNVISVRVRHALAADPNLSAEGKSVKIITRDGKVTLHGVVKDDNEKRMIEDETKHVQGVKDVDNELQVLKQ